MRRRERDRQIEHLLDGEPSGDPGLDALDPLVSSLGEPDEIDDHVAAAHIAAAAAAAAEAPDAAPDPAPTRRRRWFTRGAISGLTAKIVLGAAVALAATGGVAATGALPRPVQSFFADTVSHVGIELPDARLAPYTTTTTTSSTSTTSTTVAAAPATTAAPTTTSTTAVTTTTTEPDDEAEAAAAGSYEWRGTACDGAPISIAYRVTDDGRLAAGNITGDVDEVSARSDRIRVRFTDDIRVGIRLDDGEIATDEDRDCGGDDEGDEDETTSTTKPDDDDSSGSGSGDASDEDDSDDSDDPDDSDDEESDD